MGRVSHALSRRVHLLRDVWHLRILPDGMLLTMHNRGGSVQHYYHFVLGFLVPLVHAWPRLHVPAGGRVYIRSCGPMDPILQSLKLDGLEILPVGSHDAMKARAGLLRLTGPRIESLDLPGFDTPDAYDAPVFLAARQALFDRIEPEILAERPAVDGLFGKSGKRVLIIDRLPADPFYTSGASEIKTSGAQRRSISNLARLHDLTRERFENVAMVTLEGRSLAFQMALFSSVDLIVAQHGAALVNLLWARPGTKVIEVLTDEDSRKPLKPVFFPRLSACMGLDHHIMGQPVRHGPVDPVEFAATLDRLTGQGAQLHN